MLRVGFSPVFVFVIRACFVSDHIKNGCRGGSLMSKLHLALVLMHPQFSWAIADDVLQLFDLRLHIWKVVKKSKSAVILISC